MLICVNVSENTDRPIKPLSFVYNGTNGEFGGEVVERHGDGLLGNPSKTKATLNYTGFFSGNLPYCGRMFLVLNHLNITRNVHQHKHIYIYIQGVTGGKDQTSGRCSLC